MVRESWRGEVICGLDVVGLSATEETTPRRYWLLEDLVHVFLSGCPAWVFLKIFSTDNRVLRLSYLISGFHWVWDD